MGTQCSGASNNDCTKQSGYSMFKETNIHPAASGGGVDDDGHAVNDATDGGEDSESEAYGRLMVIMLVCI